MDDIRNELVKARWRKSSYSGSGDQCVEVAALSGGRRAVRDSKDPASPVLVFTSTEWIAFLNRVKSGECW
ncbi:DUF397 domain-containing protein [Sphaerimonospora cavernae]|uniref:DUF397 domain-containing protein n=1 Tax=Sphaerimonospora cavernae TaxID=1740611 RepID=A0ABV6U530_9ACTN